MDPVGKGNGVVLHAVMHLCGVRLKIVRYKPVGRALDLCRPAGDPELHTDKTHRRHAKQKADNERQMIAEDGEIGVKVRWIHLFSLLTHEISRRQLGFG